MCREPQWKHCAGNDLDVNPRKTQTLEKEEESTVFTSFHVHGAGTPQCLQSTQRKLSVSTAENSALEKI